MSKVKAKEKYIVFHINGGIGKNIVATGIVKELSIKHPDRKIVVLTAHLEPWLHNPRIHRVYNFDRAPYFYQDYIQDKDVLVFAQDPYLHQDYIQKKEHLVFTWGMMCGIPNAGAPELFFSKREIEFVQNNLINGPYMVLQTNGGVNPNMKQSWHRDIPLDLAAQIVHRANGAGMKVIHVRRDDQLAIQGTEQFKGSAREAWLLLKFSNASLLMDSMMQHASAAFSKKSTVLWIGNSPVTLGWGCNDNIVSNMDEDLKKSSAMFSLFEPYNIQGIVHECPFSELSGDLFDVEELWKSLSMQFMVKKS